MSPEPIYDSLIDYIKKNASSPVTGAEIDLIKTVFVPKRFRKKQYLLQEGEISKYSAFIIKGAMRQYSVDDKGAEHIVGLFIENSWARDRESLMTGTPSIYFIDAWEETDVLLLSLPGQNTLMSIPAIAE